MKTTEKVRVKNITIMRAEGSHAAHWKPGVKKEFKDWHSARVAMACAGQLPHKGYDKFDLWVEWENGETYKGRLDAKHPTEPDNDLDPAKHIRDVLKFYSGTARPYHLTQAQYDQACADEETRAECIKMLEMLEV